MQQVLNAIRHGNQLLRNMLSLEDLKVNRRALMNSVIEPLRLTAQELRTLAAASPDERNRIMDQGNVHRDEEQRLKAEMDREKRRIMAIPGATAFINEMERDLEATTAPLSAEIDRLMNKVMTEMMGSLAESVGVDPRELGRR